MLYPEDLSGLLPTPDFSWFMLGLSLLRDRVEWALGMRTSELFSSGVDVDFHSRIMNLMRRNHPAIDNSGRMSESLCKSSNSQCKEG